MLNVPLSDSGWEEHGATLHPTGVQLVQHVGGIFEGELLRGDLDLALAVELHQLRQVVVCTHDVADDVELAQQQVDRFDRQAAAVANLRVRAAAMQHLDRRIRRAVLADEVEDDVGALSVGDLSHRVDATVQCRMERFVGTQPAGEVESLGACIEGDHAGAAQRLQDLDAEVAETAHAEHDGGGPGMDDRQKLFDGVIRGDAGVGERSQ